VGKTHLAEHVARESDAYSGGVFVTRLGGVASPELLWSAVGESVGVAHVDARDAQSRVIRAIGKKQVLLILDGFEHLVRAATSVQSFLEQTPKARVLVTSRERLNVSAEAVFDLEGLTVPERDERADPAKHASIQLFLHRARLVAPRFALTPDTERSVSRICQLVGGLPLAIEMAASMLRSLDCAALAAELERSVDILQSTLRDAPLRHRTLRAVFEQSWALLDNEQRDALGRLSVFAAGFSRDAARAVTGVSVHTLAALVDKSLLRYTGSDRYQLHEVIQQHARQRLPTATRNEVALAHADYYGAFVEARAPALKGKQQEVVAKDLISDLAEVRAGWQYAISTGQEALLEKYVDGLYSLYQMRGWFREGAIAFRPASDGEVNSRSKARVLARYGVFLLRIGELTSSREAEMRSLRLFRKLDARSDMPFVLRALAEYATVKGRYAVAARLLRHSARLCTESGNRSELASTLLHMATALLPSGRYMEAEAGLRQSIALLESLGDESTLSVALTSLGAFLVDHGETDEAEEVLKRALVASRSFGNTRITAAALLNLGQLSLAGGDVSGASALSREALEGFQAAGIEEGIVAASRVLGDIYLSMGQEDDALRHYRLALQSAGRIGSVRWTMAPLGGIAEVFVRRGDTKRAADLLALILHEKATDALDRANAEALSRRLELTLTPDEGSRPPVSLEEALHYLDSAFRQ
jgi:predicted ATPase/predicted negative regulator of RcsB-dependent stress response